jgi:hypothetical protein
VKASSLRSIAAAKAAVDNLVLAPETVLALAEDNLDLRRIAAHNTRGAQPRHANGSKVILK